MDRNIFTSRLSLTLLKNILLLSGILTLLLTTVQLVSSYYDRKDLLLKFVSELEEVHMVPLAQTLFELDHRTAKKMIDGIQSYEAIQYVSISPSRTEKFSKLTAGVLDPNNAGYELTSSIVYKAYGDVFTLGTLEIVTNKQYLYSQINDSFYVILATQAIKTFVVSIALLALFYYVIIRRISSIHHWITSYSPTNSFEPVNFASAKIQNDEIEELRHELNIMGSSLQRHTEELESLVEIRTKALEEANHELEKLAYTDSLTGVANRGAFFRTADEEYSRSRRLSYDLGLMMLDLDFFKSINDSFGHEVGDEVLKMVTKSLTKCLRKEDTLGRLGGEEFAILVPGADKEGMHKLAIRLQKSLTFIDYSSLSENLEVTMSIGYTKVKNDEIFKSALSRADKFLYEAKSSGRNTFMTDREFVYSIVR